MVRRDDDAFAALVRPHVDRLYRTAILLTGGDHHRSEDLVQSALVKLYARRGWQRVEHPGAYLRQILVNEHISSGRRRSSTEILVDRPPEPGRRTGLEGDPSTHLDLFRALAQLSRTDRTVVVLRYWDDLSVADRSALDGYQVTLGRSSTHTVGQPQGSAS